MGTLRAAFAGLSFEAAAGGGNVVQSKGSTFSQRPIFSNGPSRGSNVVSLPRQQQQARVGAFSQSASALIDTEYRPGTANKSQRGGYAVPLPEFVTVSPPWGCASNATCALHSFVKPPHRGQPP